MNRLRTIAVVLMLAALAACDNVVEPVSEGVQSRYVVYGVLDMRSDQQVFRIEALRPTILAEDDGLDGVRVVLSDTETGQRVGFRDSVVTRSDADPIHLFVADFLPESGRTYSLDISRSGELGTVATTAVPETPVLLRDEALGDVSTLSQTVYVVGVNARPENVTVIYTVALPGGEEERKVPVSYGRITEAAVGDLVFPIKYYADRFVVMNMLGLDVDEPGVRLRRIDLQVDIPSKEWGQTLPNNITRGHGFFASVGRYSFTWRLDDASVSTLGWIDEQAGE